MTEEIEKLRRILNRENLPMRCPYCNSENFEVMIHIFWENNLKTPQHLADIKNGRKEFAPFGKICCPDCERWIYIHCLGDLEGFSSYCFTEYEQFRTFDKMMKQAWQKGISPLAIRLGIDQFMR